MEEDLLLWEPLFLPLLSSRHALNLVCLSLGFKWSLQEQLAFSGPGLLFRAVERSGLF